MSDASTCPLSSLPSSSSSSCLRAGRAADLAPGGRKLVFREGAEAILVMNIGGRFYALDNSCPHAGASIASGSCEGHSLSCPAHGLTFDVRSGQCTASPNLRIRTHDAQVTDGELIIRPNES